MRLKNSLNKILRDAYNKRGRIPALCCLLERTEFSKDWNKYWKSINTDNKVLMCMYFENHYTNEKSSLLRLLVIEDFKLYLKEKKQCKKR